MGTIIMNNKNFSHLHLHDQLSLLDGYGSATKYIAKAKELGFNYIALTNHGNITGLIKWQKECRKQNIHSVLGAELYIVPNFQIKEKKEKRGHITILIKNRNGWANLCYMLTIANLEGFYYRPRIDYNLLLSHLDGLIIMTACAGSFLNLPKSEEFLFQLYNKIPDNLYWEIMPHDIPSQHTIHSKIKTLSKKFSNIQFCVTNDCHWINKDDAEAQEMLLAIQQRKKWDDPKRWKFGFDGLHLRTADEMIEAFQKQGDWSENIILEGMKNTIKIARQCFQFRIPKQEISLPRSPLAQNVKNEAVLLDAICKEGYEKIFGNNDWPQIYKDRYLEEFKLIKKKHFIRYFLIVYDLINWAKENNIMVGPGRGSAAGSLISFLTGITQVNPIVFSLSFSRFISDDRIGLPDIDIDFEKRFRGKVVKYLEDTYGKYNTCGISTIGSMKSKAAIRDVCRVMNISINDTNSFASSISMWNNEKNSSAIQASIDGTKEGKYFFKKHPNVTNLALKLEGQARQAGVHAAAVIISKEDLRKSDRCVLEKRNEKIVCNWDMEDSEDLPGLMKLDVLGLSTLSVLSEAKQLINAKDNSRAFYHCLESGKYLFLKIIEREFEEKYLDYKQIEFDYNKIPLEDEKTFKMLSDGNTSGIFQLSGHACTALCRKMKIHSFEDIVAVVALARPGPADSGMTENYVARKHGETWREKHLVYEEVTKDTYGLLVYQEQVMQVISKVAGLSESTADKIRKVIAKKRTAKDFDPFRKQFVQGCKKMKTLSKKEAEDFWEGLLKWSSYGFNRSHAVAYALIAYWTAYLKSHCPKEFYAASLTFGEWNEKSRDENKNKSSLLSEIRQAGYTIMPPKRKHSDAIKWQFVNNTIYVPFAEITGVGENSANKCLEPAKQNRLQGFFGAQYDTKKQDTKLNRLLEELKVDDPEKMSSAKALSKYLPHIDFKGNETEKYPNLEKVICSSIPDHLDWFLKLENINPAFDIPNQNIIRRKRFRLEKQIIQCNGCNLRKQVKKRPVLSSMGLYNVVILLEAPGKQEDKESKGAVGKAGQVLWEELAKYNYNRRFFHLTNCVHCWPSQSKTPSYIEISACYKWLHYELEQLECRLILACGNIPLYTLTGRKGGITELSGTTEWVENIGAWICFCVHPSAVLRNEKQNLKPFQEGIKNFITKLELLK